MEIKGNFINYGNYIDIHDNQTVNVGTGDGEFQINNQSVHLPACITYNQGLTILNTLKNQGFVRNDTDSGSFLYQMGSSDQCPDEVKPTIWLKSKQLLREFLELWLKEPLENHLYKKTMMESICPKLFVNSEGQPVELAKNKPTFSHDSDMLKNLFATSADQL